MSSGHSRRSVIKAAAWSTPVVVVGAPAAAHAASPPGFAVEFDGGGGSNGYLNSVYLNLGTVTGSSTSDFTLTAPLVITIAVIGLNPNTTTERSFAPSSSHGTVVRGAYVTATRTTPVTWTLPAGEVIPLLGSGTRNPDLLFSFGGGLSGGVRITNKIVITGVAGGGITSPSAPPIDSSVVRDKNQGAVSPDGIY